VINTCKAGVVGTFPALNARTDEVLDTWLEEIGSALAAHRRAHPTAVVAPYGVNLIVHKTNPRLQANLERVVRHRVPIVITSLGAARDVIGAVHAYGGLVWHDVTNVVHARKAADAGVDGLILVCAGAGGHAGAASPFALLPRVRRRGAVHCAGGGAQCARAARRRVSVCLFGRVFLRPCVDNVRVLAH
jgi:nitronate monooxygenase